MQIGTRVAFDSAYALTKDNQHRLQGNSRNDGKSGFERSHTGAFPNIGVRPKFKLSRDARFFTIGSCFARNIEHELRKMNVDVITMKYVIPDELYELTGVGARNGALNAYTPNSMLELVNVHGRLDKNICGIVQTADDEWCDMLVTGIRPVNAAERDHVRSQMLGAYQELPSADVVVVTLGFTESWFDTQDSMFVNRSPAGSRKLMRAKDRFEFLNASPGGVEETVDSIVLSIRRSTNNQAKIVISVSPVPIHGTFTDQDVISANTYSKCTLLSAAVSVASRYEFVDYYPSYEMVTMTQAEDAWEADGIHVKPSCVNQVIRTFADAYF